MFLLDTMVVSELRKGRRAHPQVDRWAARLTDEVKKLSVITMMELRIRALGVARRDPAQAAALHAWVEAQVSRSGPGNLLPVTLQIANHAAAF